MATTDFEPNPAIARWNAKYARRGQTGTPVTPQAEPELLQHRALLPGAGLALEAACGRGANALFLAQSGYQVIACDLAINGLLQAQTARAAASRRFMPLVCDLTTCPFPAAAFSLICVIRFLDRRLFPRLLRWLRPGGVLFCKTFNRHHLQRQPRFNPAYVVEPGELNRIFGALDILVSDAPPARRTADTVPGASFILGSKPAAAGRRPVSTSGRRLS